MKKDDFDEMDENVDPLVGAIVIMICLVLAAVVVYYGVNGWSW